MHGPLGVKVTAKGHWEVKGHAVGKGEWDVLVLCDAPQGREVHSIHRLPISHGDITIHVHIWKNKTVFHAYFRMNAWQSLQWMINVNIKCNPNLNHIPHSTVQFFFWGGKGHTHFLPVLPKSKIHVWIPSAVTVVLKVGRGVVVGTRALFFARPHAPPPPKKKKGGGAGPSWIFAQILPEFAWISPKSYPKCFFFGGGGATVMFTLVLRSHRYWIQCVRSRSEPRQSS